MVGRPTRHTRLDLSTPLLYVNAPSTCWSEFWPSRGFVGRAGLLPDHTQLKRWTKSRLVFGSFQFDLQDPPVKYPDVRSYAAHICTLAEFCGGYHEMKAGINGLQIEYKSDSWDWEWLVHTTVGAETVIIGSVIVSFGQNVPSEWCYVGDEGLD